MYTLVRHSAFHQGNALFENAVEEQHIANAMAGRVAAAGGRVFDEYKAAYQAAYVANYPAGVNGVVPKVEGRFVNLGSIHDLFIPAETVS